MDTSRRGWMLGLGMTALGEIATAQQHAHEAVRSGAAAGLEILDAATAADLDALTAQIIPSSDGPGAREAGVFYFIDRALATFEAGQLQAYRSGMKEIDDERRKLFTHSTSIASLSPAQQIALLHSVEKTPFFELLRTHTVWGFVGSPIYGGNRGRAGWAHIGFDDRMNFQPPFGYYDAEANKS